MSRVEDRLDDVEIAYEPHYSFILSLNGTITDTSAIRLIDSDASNHMIVQDKKKN